MELQRRGRSVLLLDAAEPGRGASFGNMASIAISEFMPISRPAVWRQIPSWLLDPQGPVRIRPGYLPKALPWFLRFMWAGLPWNLGRLEAAGAALCARVYDDLVPLLERNGLADMLSPEGCLALYADDGEFAADRDHIDLLERVAIPHELLGHNALHALEPSLAPTIRRAILLPQNRSISDPFTLATRLFDRFLALGGRFQTGRVASFDRTDGRITALALDDGATLEAQDLILCAGSRTGELAHRLGEAIPLETERGYHTQIMAPGLSLRHSLIRPAKAFMVTPTAGGIRVGGTVEVAGHDAPPDFARSDITVRRAKEVLPDLQLREATRWMGHCPALPDTIPIISASARTHGVFYATGHGHLGLTLAATTAALMGDLVSGTTPSIAMRPYRADRF